MFFFLLGKKSNKNVCFFFFFFLIQTQHFKIFARYMFVKDLRTFVNIFDGVYYAYRRAKCKQNSIQTRSFRYNLIIYFTFFYGVEILSSITLSCTQIQMAHFSSIGIPINILLKIQTNHNKKQSFTNFFLDKSPPVIINYNDYYGSLWRCPWYIGYRHRKWTRRHEFKSWTRLIAFHIALIPLGMVCIQLFSLQL